MKHSFSKNTLIDKSVCTLCGVDEDYLKLLEILTNSTFELKYSRKSFDELSNCELQQVKRVIEE